MGNVPETFGALLVGGIVSGIFSGIAIVQTFAYFKFYQKDRLPLKLLVLVVWLLDVCHMFFVSCAIWHYLIDNFGKPNMIDVIPWSLALTIAFTAILTFLVHSFFVHRIHKLSKNNYFVSVPLGILACGRLAFACLTTDKMMRLRSLNAFMNDFAWSFTTGLAISATLDVLITALLCIYLKSKQKRGSSLNNVLDSLMLYAFESGCLTCAATLVSLICWLTMRHNLIFMGLHFVISKFYANSLLATLNSRKSLRLRGASQSQPSSSTERVMPVMFPDDFGGPRSPGGRRFSSRQPSKPSQTKSEAIELRVNVEKTTMCKIDESDSSPPPTSAHDTV